MSKIFRFKFSEQILVYMQEFTRIHKFEEREDFKESWEKWVNDNSQIILDEQTDYLFWDLKEMLKKKCIKAYDIIIEKNLIKNKNLNKDANILV